MNSFIINMNMFVKFKLKKYINLILNLILEVEGVTH